MNPETICPVPDPTVLTTQQLLREVGSLRDTLEAKLHSIEHAISLTHVDIDKCHASIEHEVAHLRMLHEEKFHSIAVQFEERDTRTEQQSLSSKVAVDAALQAAKEAVGEQNKSSSLAIDKAASSTTKQIDQISVTIATVAENLSGKIEDAKTRIGLVEGSNLAARGQGQGMDKLWGYLVALAGIAIAIVAMLK